MDASDEAGISVDLSDLLKAFATGRRTVTLDDGTIGMLPEAWLARVAPVLALGEAGTDGIRFKPSQVALLDVMLAEQPEVDWDEGFARARERMQRFAGVEPEDPPPTFQGTLREYQRQALGWMRFLREFGFGGCLADDMGLGKTVMVLAMLEGRRLDTTRPHRPSLIVLPRSLLFNWMSEAARFAPGLRVLDFAHADRHSAMDAIAHADLVLTTYGTLRRDVPALQQHHFDYVALDEAQAIKNAGQPRRRPCACCAPTTGWHSPGRRSRTISANCKASLISSILACSAAVACSSYGDRQGASKPTSTWPGSRVACGRSSSAGPRSRSHRSCHPAPRRRSTANSRESSAASIRNCAHTIKGSC